MSNRERTERAPYRKPDAGSEECAEGLVKRCRGGPDVGSSLRVAQECSRKTHAKPGRDERGRGDSGGIQILGHLGRNGTGGSPERRRGIPDTLRQGRS